MRHKNIVTVSHINVHVANPSGTLINDILLIYAFHPFASFSTYLDNGTAVNAMQKTNIRITVDALMDERGLVGRARLVRRTAFYTEYIHVKRKL